MVIIMRTKKILLISLVLLVSFTLAALSTNYYAIADDEEFEDIWEDLYDWDDLYEDDREDAFFFPGLGAFGSFGLGGNPFGSV